ncbi:MAG: hypothetical protein NTY19_49345 [Planctomycetota bacterium]|nr:hypothetical protein [Planctomycetota bacterium]
MYLPKQAPPVQRPSTATQAPAKDKAAGVTPQADCVCRTSPTAGPTFGKKTLQCVIGRTLWDTKQLC